MKVVRAGRDRGEKRRKRLVVANVRFAKLEPLKRIDFLNVNVELVGYWWAFGDLVPDEDWHRAPLVLEIDLKDLVLLRRGHLPKHLAPGGEGQARSQGSSGEARCSKAVTSGCSRPGVGRSDRAVRQCHLAW